MKKFIALLMALVMTMSLATVAWGATETVTTSTMSAQRVIASGEDVVLTADAPVTITVDSSVVDAFVVKTGGKLTIGANVTITGEGALIYVEGGELVVEGKVISTGDTYGTICVVGDTAKVTVKNGATVSSAGNSAIGIEVVKNVGNPSGVTDGGTVNIEGGTVSTGAADTYAAVFGYTGTINVTGGTISSANTTPALLASSDSSTPATVTVSGGNVDSVGVYNDADADDVTITGGTFSDDVSEYVAEGSSLVNGTVVPASSVGANILSGNYFVKGTNAGAVASAAVVSATDAKAPKDANKNNTIDANEVGNVKYFNIAGDTAKYIQVASVGEADMIVYYSNTESVFAYLKAVPSVEYYGTGVPFANFGEKCGQVDYEPVTGVKYYTFENVVYETSKTAATRYLMVGNELVGVKPLGVAPVAHVPAYTYDKDYKVVGVKCAECGCAATLYANWASVPKAAQAVAVPLGDGRYYVWTTAGAGAGDTVVESAKTFDAGIAMYVGMSVMAAAGSAVVLKKKD